MKNLLLLSFLSICIQSNAQSVFYQENFGDVTATSTPIADHVGFSNSAPVVYSGSATIRNSTPSTGYEGASAAGCVFLGASPSSPDQYILIEGINSVNYSDITMSLGHYKGTNAASNELMIEVSSDGSVWESLTYTRPTGSGTSSWILIEPVGNIPSASNLRIRFTNPNDSNVGFRIDDLKLTGTDTTLSTSNEMKGEFKIYPNPVADGTIYITNQNNDELDVKIYDIMGKMVKSTKAIDKVSIDGFASGIYLMRIELKGQSITKKIAVK